MIHVSIGSLRSIIDKRISFSDKERKKEISDNIKQITKLFLQPRLFVPFFANLQENFTIFYLKDQFYDDTTWNYAFQINSTAIFGK